MTHRLAPAAMAFGALLLASCAVAPPDNIAPLAFGMTEAEAAAALGAPLAPVAGRPGQRGYSAEYLADRSLRIGLLSFAAERYSLQFRNGRLTGWKRQWLREPRP